MSDVLIQAALEKHLQAMPGNLPTAFENMSFSPVSGEPYQRVTLIPAEPFEESMGRRLTEYEGLFQVTLHYPAGEGRGAAQTQAEAIRQRFKPVQTLEEGGVKVNLTRTAKVAAGYPDGDRWVIPVTIRWQTYIAS